MSQTNKNRHLWEILLWVFVVALLIFRAEVLPLSDWEGRLGINALIMAETGEWLTPQYFDFQEGARNYTPDLWHPRPPLNIWVKTLALGGLQDLAALRIPDVLACLFTFFFLFRLINLYEENDFAFFTCLIILATDSIVNLMQLPLNAFGLAFMVGAVYHFLLWHDFLKVRSALISGLFFGFAFLSEGGVPLWVILGLCLYSLLQKNAFKMIKNYRFWLWFFSTITIPLLWLLVLQQEKGGGLFYTDFQEVAVRLNYSYSMPWALIFFNYGLWLFFLPVSLALSIYFYFFEKKQILHKKALVPRSKGLDVTNFSDKTGIEKIVESLKLPNVQLTLLSLCLWLPLLSMGILLQDSTLVRWSWLFGAIIIASGIFYLNQKTAFFYVVFLVLLTISMTNNLYELWYFEAEEDLVLSQKEKIKKADRVIWYGELPSEQVLFRLKSLQFDLNFKGIESSINHRSDNELVGVLRKEYQMDFEKFRNYSVVAEKEDYLILAPIFY